MVDGWQRRGEGKERRKEREGTTRCTWAEGREGWDGGRWDRDTQVARSKRLEGGRGARG